MNITTGAEGMSAREFVAQDFARREALQASVANGIADQALPIWGNTRPVQSFVDVMEQLNRSQQGVAEPTTPNPSISISFSGSLNSGTGDARVPVSYQDSFPGPMFVYPPQMPYRDNTASDQIRAALGLLSIYLPQLGQQGQLPSIDLSTVIQPLWDEILRLRTRIEEVNRMYEEVLYQVETQQLAAKQTEQVA